MLNHVIIVRKLDVITEQGQAIYQVIFEGAIKLKLETVSVSKKLNLKSIIIIIINLFLRLYLLIDKLI